MNALVITNLDDDQVQQLIEAIGLRLQTPLEIGESWNSIHTKKDTKPVWTKLTGEEQGA